VTRPEDALEQARRAAAGHRAEYGHVDPTRLGPPFEQIAARLSEWAIPDPTGYEIRSIRRFGAPITWLKRLLVRFLYQFHIQLISDQSRFNVLLLNYVRLLEQRVTDLETQLRGDDDAEVPDAVEDDWA
jgi:hypothetical protein